MPLTDLEKAKILVAIDKKRKEIEKLKSDLLEKEKMNSGAWNTYGSELCAGGMESEENEIKSRVTLAETDLKILEDALSGALDVSKEGFERKEGVLDNITKHIERITEEKEEHLVEMNQMKRVQELIEKI